MPAPSHPVRSMMQFFIGDILGRKLTPADYRGRHMKAASILLKKMGYDYEAVEGALYSLRDRQYEHFGYESESDLPSPPLTGMEILYRWGEPPLIDRWIAPPPMPPVYSHDYDKWVMRWGNTAIKQGVWDGLYTRQDPREVESWLRFAIGDAKFEESIKQWQTQNRTSRQRKP